MSELVPYGHMVHEYYVRRVREVTEARRERLKQVRTRAPALRLVRSVRRKIADCFGPFPKRSPLQPEVRGVLDREAYTIEKIVLHSRPAFPVTANLYLPKGKRPCPVLGTCGHAQEGKALGVYQSFAQGLARQGYAVLIYDPIGQGERYQ